MSDYKKESHLRSLIKGMSWRIIATSDTILVVLAITCMTGNCSLGNALKIGFIEFFIKFIFYYGHERLWQGVLFHGKVAHKQIVYKTISWRMIAMTITFLISGSVLDAFDQIALYIAITETFTKLALYYFHEKLWLKLPLGRIRKLIFGKKIE